MEIRLVSVNTRKYDGEYYQRMKTLIDGLKKMVYPPVIISGFM